MTIHEIFVLIAASSIVDSDELLRLRSLDIAPSTDAILWEKDKKKMTIHEIFVLIASSSIVDSDEPVRPRSLARAFPARINKA